MRRSAETFEAYLQMRRKTTNGHAPAQARKRWVLTALIAAMAAPQGGFTQTQPPAAVAVQASASNVDPTLALRELVEQAVLNNPEVLARWHAVKAVQAERDAARGGFLPRADLSMAAGPERRSQINGQYSRSFGTLTLNQLLYDGFATAAEVRRLDHATRTRLFELMDVSEAVALEAVRAYFDVVRYRELVRLAEDNFVEHRAVYSQTDQKVKAKIARAVDLEQITGRLALAEANLLIETSNLHDTSARFQRIIGRMPGRAMALPAPLDRGFPSDGTNALTRAQQSNPAILAAIENVRASEAAMQTRTAAYQPRLDFRLRREQGRNLDGIPGNTNTTAAEVVLNWNLFNGFADRARERQFGEQLNITKDLRDKTCRDIRQTTIIAFNDVVKLKEQLEYLLIHEAALTKALTAYRQQFQIGQRTLLDLLDTENELFQARRAVVNARHDLGIAHARTQASVGNLLRALDVTRLATESEEQLQGWNEGPDGPRGCPAEPIAVHVVDKDALVQRAMQLAVKTQLIINEQIAREKAAQEAARPASAPAGTSAAPAVPQQSAEEQAVKAALEAWRAAWAKRDAGAYLLAYAPEFTPAGGQSREAWERRRREILGRASGVTVEITDVSVALEGKDKARTTFLQNYRSASYADSVRKILEWQRVDGRWLIMRETAEPASTTR